MIEGGAISLSHGAMSRLWEKLSAPEQMAISFQYAKQEQINKLLTEIPVNHDAIIRINSEMIHNKDAYVSAVAHLEQLEAASRRAK